MGKYFTRYPYGNFYTTFPTRQHLRISILFHNFFKKGQNSNLIIISSTNTSTLKSIIYSGLKFSQLINNSDHGKLQPGAVSTIRKLCINRRKNKLNYKKDQKPTKQTGINYSNLHTIKLMENQDMSKQSAYQPSTCTQLKTKTYY